MTANPVEVSKTNHPADDKSAETQRRRDTIRYVAEMALELRHVASDADQTFLASLLEMAFYEASTIANGAPPDLARLRRRRVAA